MLLVQLRPAPDVPVFEVIERVTAEVFEVTVLPAASSIVTTGWVGNDDHR